MTKTPARASDQAALPRVECGFAAEGLCDLDNPPYGRCERCERYTELLRSARALYSDVRWVVTPDGMLEGVDR